MCVKLIHRNIRSLLKITVCNPLRLFLSDSFIFLIFKSFLDGNIHILFIKRMHEI